MITSKQWAALEKAMESAMGSAELQIDGLKIDLEVRRYKPLRYCICIFVNGKWSHKWDAVDCEERRRFACKRVHQLFRGDKKKKWIKFQRLNKRLGVPTKPLNPTFDTYSFCWMSFLPLKKQLIQTSKELSLISINGRQVDEEGNHVESRG